MRKKAAAASFGLVFLALPLLAAADTSVADQVAALQAQVKQLLALIAQVQGRGESTSCVNLNRTLTLGSDGQDVTNLQNYLIAKGDLDAQYSTGHFGFLTAEAVGKLQTSLGIVSDENDPAYGFVGPKTRAAIACRTNIPRKSCPGYGIECMAGYHAVSGGVDANNCSLAPKCVANTMPSGALYVSTTSGVAPLEVSFSMENLVQSDLYVVEFGDGKISDQFKGSDTLSTSFSLSHTYGASGTYRARLLDQSSTADCGDNTQYCKGSITDSLTITATGSGSSSSSAMIDQSSLASSSSNPTITGNAKSLSQVVLKVTGNNGAVAGYNDGRSGTVSSDGHWSINLSYLDPGTYIVYVYRTMSDEMNSGVSGGNYLTYGTLVVGDVNKYSIDLKVNGSEGPVNIANKSSFQLSWSSNGMDGCFICGSISTQPGGDPAAFNNLATSGSMSVYARFDPGHQKEVVELTCNKAGTWGHLYHEVLLTPLSST